VQSCSAAMYCGDAACAAMYGGWRVSPQSTTGRHALPQSTAGCIVLPQCTAGCHTHPHSTGTCVCFWNVQQSPDVYVTMCPTLLPDSEIHPAHQVGGVFPSMATPTSLPATPSCMFTLQSPVSQTCPQARFSLRHAIYISYLREVCPSTLPAESNPPKLFPSATSDHQCPANCGGGCGVD
jgi:hypothetical protein